MVIRQEIGIGNGIIQIIMMIILNPIGKVGFAQNAVEYLPRG
jgi:hypothetical protein